MRKGFIILLFPLFLLSCVDSPSDSSLRSSNESNSSNESSVSSEPSDSSSEYSSSSSSSSSKRNTYIKKDNASWPLDEANKRIVPITSEDNETPVYTLTSGYGGDYLVDTGYSLVKGGSYITYEEVALYYVTFNEFPSNYKWSKNKMKDSNDRLISSYENTHSHQYDYTVALGEFSGGYKCTYYELDISISNYSKSSRGAGRLVIVPEGIDDYGDGKPVCYFTKDHYADFCEFYNYAGGWSREFKGVYNKSGNYVNSPESEIDRPIPTTINPISMF